VIGVDSSAEMIDAAQTHAIDGRLIFEQADLREWEPEAPIDVLVSNATLQWVPGHLELLPRFVGMLAPKGWFAFQVPGNFGEPSHVLLHELRTSPRWREKLGQDSSRAAAVHDPATYLEALSDLGMTVDAWETTYLQVLFGDDAVLQWTKGTALRPVLAALGETEREQFLNEYGALLREAYPQREYGTVFPFRRIFVVAYSKDA
jgi:trans-aconitate 2-methyltransferase